MLNLLLLLFALQQTPNHINTDKSGLAVAGYDPVSYFEGSPLIGSRNYEFKYAGARYWFSSMANQKKFEANPENYIPKYGGWCAYALGLAPDKVKIDPETYKIIEGKLYLFYNFKGVNTLTLWDKDESLLLPQADKNWSQIIKE